MQESSLNNPPTPTPSTPLPLNFTTVWQHLQAGPGLIKL